MVRTSDAASSHLPGTREIQAQKDSRSPGSTACPTRKSRRRSTMSMVAVMFDKLARFRAALWSRDSGVNVGTNAEDSAPSANSSRARLGMR